MSFKPIDINILLKRFLYGIKNYNSAFGLPVSKIFKGSSEQDISVSFHNKKASTSLGPAAGPHSQLAQNIVLSWLAGSRIIELKTIQINDNLKIPRPCIDAPNICFNVEFSQELTLEESLREYVKAYIIIEIIKAEGIIDFKPNSTDTIFEMSIGYNLEGITTNKIRNYINSLKDASLIIEELKSELKGEFEKYKDFNFEPHILNSITLSTFHGCPASEIQKIGEFLLEEMNINTTIKLNPTLLGREKLSSLLYKKLDYHHIRVNEGAYEQDIGFDNAITMIKALYGIAGHNKLSIGVKFTNTLEVLNNRGIFKDKVMYMSGESLHLLAMTLVNDFRKTLKSEDIHMSFSGGISEYNFADVSALGLIPITVCTDLLRPRGYARLYGYIDSLYKKMKEFNVSTLADYTLVRFDSNSKELKDCVKHNTVAYLNQINKDCSFYSNLKNSSQRKKKDISLDIFDCSSCGNCISVCPNGANFSYNIPLPDGTDKVDIEYRDYLLTMHLSQLKVIEMKKSNRFKLGKLLQFANYIDSCNECGNCDTFCPETGGPFKSKPAFFSSLKDYENNETDRLNTFYIDNNNPDKPTIYATLKGKKFSLTIDKTNKTNIFTIVGKFSLIFDAETHTFKDSEILKHNLGSYTTELQNYFTFLLILSGVLNKKSLNNININ